MDTYLQTPQFGIVITIIVYAVTKKLYDKTKFPLLYPLLSASVVIIGFLYLFNITFETYNIGGGMISYVLGPVTVILAVPLYKQQAYLKKYFLSIISGTVLGSIFSILLIHYMVMYFGLGESMTISLLPKSVTAPIAKGISEQLGGVASITVFAVILTGVTGPIVAPVVIKLLRIKNKIAQGIGLGTASHGGGTAKALEYGEIQGAMSGLAMGLSGMITAILLPILLEIL